MAILPKMVDVLNRCPAQAFTAHPSVEALDELIPGGLAWGRVVPFDLGVAAPFEHGVQDQFGSSLQ